MCQLKGKKCAPKKGGNRTYRLQGLRSGISSSLLRRRAGLAAGDVGVVGRIFRHVGGGGVDGVGYGRLELAVVGRARCRKMKTVLRRCWRRGWERK